MSSKTGGAVDASVGAQLIELREAKGLDHAAVAQGLTVTLSQVIDWESGAVRLAPSELFACARFFGVAPSYFFKDLAVSSGRLPGDDYDSRSAKYL